MTEERELRIGVLRRKLEQSVRMPKSIAHVLGTGENLAVQILRLAQRHGIGGLPRQTDRLVGQRGRLLLRF